VTGSGFIVAMTLTCIAINWFYFLMFLVVWWGSKIRVSGVRKGVWFQSEVESGVEV